MEHPQETKPIELASLLGDGTEMPASSTSPGPEPEAVRLVEGPSDEGYEDFWARALAPKDRFKYFFYRLWQGPETPEDNPPPRIQPLLYLEELPERLATRFSKSVRVSVLAIYLLGWFLVAYNVVHPYLTQPSQLAHDPSVEVVYLSCLELFWKGKNGECGIDGNQCPTVPENTDVVIRCPALCDRGSWTFTMIPVGDQQVKHRGFYIGGGAHSEDDLLTHPYRGDSFPCGAAVHSGLISPFFGGCARLSYESGSQAAFPGTGGHYGVGSSVTFDSFFGHSFVFRNLAGSFSNCYDPRLLVLVLNIVLGAPVVYLALGAVFFWTVNVVGFWTIVLATDPPVTVNVLDLETYSELISVGLERLLPTCCILYVLWHTSVRHTLGPYPPDLGMLKSPLTNLVLWYPLYWLGILNNMTFDRLPVDRLTLHDIQEQPGALLAIVSIIGVIVTCAFIQGYKIWLSGRFRFYLAIYGLFVASLVVISSLPGLTLRIHHYILAMLLIPGCATRGRTAVMFQGILLGLFISGASRWGLASIAETVTSLLRNDPSGKVLPPTFGGYDVESGVLSWLDDPLWANSTSQAKYTSVSLLINDVERYVGDGQNSVNLNDIFATHDDLPDLAAISNAEDAQTMNIYLRLGRKVPGEGTYSDFTNAGVLQWPSGEFHTPPPGIT